MGQFVTLSRAEGPAKGLNAEILRFAQDDIDRRARIDPLPTSAEEKSRVTGVEAVSGWEGWALLAFLSFIGWIGTAFRLALQAGRETANQDGQENPKGRILRRVPWIIGFLISYALWCLALIQY